MRPLNWVLMTSVISMLWIGLAAGSSSARSEQVNSNSPYWTLLKGVVPEGVDLFKVFMLDESNAWATGSVWSGSTHLAFRVYKLQWQDGLWKVAYTQDFPAPVNDIVATSDNNVWVVGNNGLFMHKDERGWRDLPSPLIGDAATTFMTIQMFGSGEEGWAGGMQNIPNSPTASRGFLLHYNQGQWQEDRSMNNPYSVDRLHFVQGSGWAIGIGSIWRYGRAGWVEEAMPPCPPQVSACKSWLYSVRALTGDQAWAVGEYSTTFQPPFSPHAMALRRVNGIWERVLPGATIVGDPYAAARTSSALGDISFSQDNVGIAVGTQTFYRGGNTPSLTLPFVISSQNDGRWRYEVTPAFPRESHGTLRAISQADSGHALAVGNLGVIFAYGYGGPTPTPPIPIPTPQPQLTPLPPPAANPPTERVPDPREPGVAYFPVVGHTLRGGFRAYWEQHGGLAQFGYPITEEFGEESTTDGKTYVVQYFERARFEWHPQNKSPFEVLLGLLGRTITQGRESEPPFRPAPPKTSRGYIYFQPTEHNLPPEFAQYWQTHGGLPVYGYPISEAFTEVSPTDGKPYLVQYFERHRFEYHPELPGQYRVSLGLLGVQVLEFRGWIRE